MFIVNKDIWLDADELDYICITTNSVVKNNFDLVMGAGIAKEANNRVKGLAKDFGRQICQLEKKMGVYGLLVDKTKKYIAFQTKIHYKDGSPLHVVQKSTRLLYNLAIALPDKTFGLPYPAVNHGGRSKAEIYPIISVLPDNVIVYEK